MQEVERSFVGLEQVAQRAFELRTHNNTRLQLACLPALAHALVPQSLARLCKSHPDAQCECGAARIAVAGAGRE